MILELFWATHQGIWKCSMAEAFWLTVTGSPPQAWESQGASDFEAGRRITLEKFPPPTSFFHGLTVGTADPPCPHFLASSVGFLFYHHLSSHEEAQEDRGAGKVNGPSAPFPKRPIYCSCFSVFRVSTTEAMA